MSKTKQFLISLAVFVMLVVPIFSFAAQDPSAKGLVTCTNDCDFKDFMALINTVIHFILFYMVVPIAAILFFYAGFKMVTSGGNAEARGKAKSIFTSAVFGLVIAAGAWLIIRTILSILGFDGAWIGFK